MMLVFLAVLEQITMQLLDVVFRQSDLFHDWKTNSMVSA